MNLISLKPPIPPRPPISTLLPVDADKSPTDSNDLGYLEFKALPVPRWMKRLPNMSNRITPLSHKRCLRAATVEGELRSAIMLYGS